MAQYVTGNLVFMSSTKDYDIQVGATSNTIDNILFEPNSPDPNSYIPFQPGKVKGFNMYVGTNTSADDINLVYRRRVWDGDKSWSNTDVTLFTIPAGESGYFCFNPSDVSEDNRTWDSRDIPVFRLTRSGTSGVLEDLTIFVCYEITEEDIQDNDYPPNKTPLVL